MLPEIDLNTRRGNNLATPEVIYQFVTDISEREETSNFQNIANMQVITTLKLLLDFLILIIYTLNMFLLLVVEK